MELDPLYQKALYYLISRKRDSAEQLKEMLFDALGREYVRPTTASSESVDNIRDINNTRSMEDDESTEEEIIDLTMDTDEGPPDKPDETMDADDFAFGMGISCIVCRQFDVTSNNQLIECQECHNLYHQLCHKPAVSEGQDTNDPRLVWYCAKCSKGVKRSEKQLVKSASKSSLSGSNKDNPKAEKSAEVAFLRRPEALKSEKLSSDSKGMGLAAFAADLSGKDRKLKDKLAKSEKSDKPEMSMKSQKLEKVEKSERSLKGDSEKPKKMRKDREDKMKEGISLTRENEAKEASIKKDLERLVTEKSKPDQKFKRTDKDVSSENIKEKKPKKHKDVGNVKS